MADLHDAPCAMGAGFMPAPSVCALCGELYVSAPGRAKYAGRLARSCDACRKEAADRWNAKAKPKKLAKSRRGKIYESECYRCGDEFTFVFAQRIRTVCDPCRRCDQEWTKFRFNHKQVAEIRAAASCAICGEKESPGGRFGVHHIDHDHETGVVRGLLCSPCNTVLGLMASNPARLRAAADYLERGTA